MGSVKPTICIGGKKAFIWAKRDTALPVALALRPLNTNKLHLYGRRTYSTGAGRVLRRV